MVKYEPLTSSIASHCGLQDGSPPARGRQLKGSYLEDETLVLFLRQNRQFVCRAKSAA